MFTLTNPVNEVRATIDLQRHYTAIPATFIAAAWSGAITCSSHPDKDLFFGLSAQPSGLLVLPSQLTMPMTQIGQWVFYDALSLDPSELAKQNANLGDSQVVAVTYDGSLAGTWDITARVTAP